MKKLFLALIILTSCQNNSKNESIHEKGSQELSEIKKLKPSVFPEKLNFTNLTHNVVLNTNIFNQYSLNKGETAEIKPDISNSDFEYSSHFIEFLIKSKFEDPQTYGAEEIMKFNISFECSNCYDAVIIRYELNSQSLPKEESLLEFLNDPSSIDRKIKRDQNNVFTATEEIKLRLNGLIGIYLILRDQKKDMFIYELAGLKSDGLAPVFRETEFCLFDGDEEYEGLVCLDTKQFEGNDYSGYSVPIKGNVFGDVTELKINGKSVTFNKGEFYKRIHMMLKTGYNQIPIIVKDKFGNTNETYIEVTLSRIKNEPSIDIDIENNIDH
jgi:hypothetical protein